MLTIVHRQCLHLDLCQSSVACYTSILPIAIASSVRPMPTTETVARVMLARNTNWSIKNIPERVRFRNERTNIEISEY